MLKLLTLAAVLHIALSSCPADYEPVKDGECRGWGGAPTVTLDQAAATAVNICDGIQGKPVIIHDDEHQEYYKKLALDPSEGYLILGIVCDPKRKFYTWSDESRIDWKPSLAGWAPELDSNNCLPGEYSFTLRQNGYWNYGGRGTAVKALVLCTTQLAPPPPGADGCDSFEDDAEDGVCYQVGAAAQNWQDASMTCKKLGADLASVHNQQENSFIRRLAVGKGLLNGVFLGAAASGKDQTFAWVDGSKMDYENYRPGFPKKNFGDCIAMDTSQSSGQWMNVDCGSLLPVACIRQQGSSDGPTCTGDDYDENTIITSPGFPNTASTPCDWFLTVPAGKKVEMEIIMLEANSCCDSLVIYDGYLGGTVLTTLSGSVQNVFYTTKTSNIMRVSWQPNGGVNVRGMMIRYRAV